MICARDQALGEARRAYCAEAAAVCAPDPCTKQSADVDCTELQATLDCARHVRCEDLPPAACTGCCQPGAKGDCVMREGVLAERKPVCSTRACTPAHVACDTHAECCMDALGRRHCDEATRTCAGTTGLE